MTAEELFYDLSNKYGEDFNWDMLPFSQSNGAFVEELKNEIGKRHPLYHKRVWAVAKCETNDDVLFVTEDGIYYIFHLTYSKQNLEGFPKFERFADLYAVKGFIEQALIAGYT